MKTLVVYYSRSGNTKKVAEAIAKELNADLEQLVDHTNRAGLLGWLFAGRDAMKKRPTTIDPPKKDPANYDLVIVGSPIWGFVAVSPAVRTYLLQTKGKIKKVAFFLTKGGSPGDKPFKDMAEVSGLKPVGLFDIKEAELHKGDLGLKIKSFVETLKKA